VCVAGVLAACAGGKGGGGGAERAPMGAAEPVAATGAVETREDRPAVRVPVLVIGPERRAVLEADLAAARAEYEADPSSEDAAIWLGRRLGYLGRYEEAIGVFGRGIAEHPQSYKLLRHRGHRYITVRDFDRAIADLTRASELIKGVRDEVEPDGAPNRLNKPRSTSHSNIWYHLGLAYYLKGDYESALKAYRRCMEFSWTNDDQLVATSQWLYITLRRLGRDREAAAVLAPIRGNMDVIENGAYYRLLMMAKGQLQAEEVLGSAGETAIDDASTGYGVGAWYWVNGDRGRAREVWGRVVKGEGAAAFGYIAAEAELGRGER